MEIATNLEDDLFFADLTQRISQLITEDEEDDPVARCPSPSGSQASCPVLQYSARLPGGNNRTGDNSKGTGVFIPRSSWQLHRKQPRGRFPSSSDKKSQAGRRSQHRVKNLLVPQAPCADSYHSKQA